jgi:GTPase SAR1 family protein
MGQAGSAESKQPNQRDIKPVDVETRSMLQRGVKHNMKIVIRGAQKTGKTSLFRRLQGLEFSRDYVPTDEIQTAVLSWKHKSSDDVVKVELWDVVDRARNFDEAETDAQRCASAVARGRMGSQRLHKLDAETVDVYKGTDGAILVRTRANHDHAAAHAVHPRNPPYARTLRIDLH